MLEAIKFYSNYIRGLMEYSHSFRDLMKEISWQGWIDSNLRTTVEIEMEEYNEKYGYRTKLTSGAYRFCLIAEDCDYVLKFSWDFEGEEDGCDTEVDIYKEACERGFAEFFAKPYKIGPIENDFLTTCDFFLMEKAEVNTSRIAESCSDLHYNKLYTTLKDREKNLDYMNDIFENNDTVEVFIEYYLNNLELLEDFIDFVNEIGLVDLHEYNIGFIGERPVIIDYAFVGVNRGDNGEGNGGYGIQTF